MSLRFCMVTTFYPPHNFGGDGMGIQRLSEALARRGHEVTVIHDTNAYNMLSHGGPPEAGPTPPNMTIHRLHNRLGKWSNLLTHQLGRPVVNGARIRAIVEEGHFDVINFHNISLVGGPGVLRIGDAVKLYMAHEHWLVCPTHVLWRHGVERCDKRECLKCVLSYRRPPQLWRSTGMLERELHHVDAFIAMSEFSRKKHAEFGFPREMEVVPYFLPDLSVSEGGSAVSDDASPHPRPYFLFVGRLERIKGLDDVIPLFRNEKRADLLIAGDGEYAGTLRELARGIDNVHFLGRVKPDDLGRYYRHARALIVPSVCYETFGIILIESFRQGTPVIARRLGPFPEIVERAGAGDLFETEDELRMAMNAFLGDDARRSRLGEAGRRAFQQHWSETAVVPQYLEVVRRAAEARGATSLLDRLEGAH
ncbi:MAG: glycosyltransferase family 4 protein [Longimicrobiales bacterium]